MPRHNLTNVNATGVGEKAATSIKNKAGKSNIWNPNVKSDFTTSDVHVAADDLPKFSTISCEVEYLRMLKTNELRKRLNRLRAEHRNETNVNHLLPAVTALERWFMRYQIENNDKKEKGDPVIPTIWKGCKKEVDKGLVSDLMVAKDSKIVATLVAADIRDEAHELSMELLKASKKEKTDIKSNKVSIERHKHTIDVKFHSKMLKINPLHYDKLKSLFDGTANSESTSHKFHQCLFCVLARYHTIQGHGFQAAVCEQAFDILLRHMKVSFECFASPLNSRYGQYCSAFPDTDVCFGSVGSFFDFHPTSGSFEANPPFEPVVMLRMINHIHTLLSSTKQPMSFVVIVPGWTECESWDLMDSSKYKTRDVELLAKDDHGFCDGASHQRRDRYRDSCFDTAIFFLQNEAGKKEFPVTERCISDLKASMAQGKPSPAMRLRQEKEGRGTADVARGVYKGKKRNATGEGVMSRRASEKSQKADRAKTHNKRQK